MDNTENDLAKRIVKELGELESKRKPLENVWQSIMEMVDPANAFINREYSAENMFKEDLYSTSALRAIPKFVAALQSTVTPPNEQWHRLIPPTRKLKKDQTCISWLEELAEDLFERRYRPAAGFNKAIIKIWYSMAKIGVGCMFIDEASDGTGAEYTCVNMKDFYVSLYDNGQIKKCYRKLKKSFWELCEDLEDKGVNPQEVIPVEIYNRCKLSPNSELNLIHAVKKLSNKEVSAFAIDMPKVAGGVEKIKRRYAHYLVLADGGRPVVLHSGFFFTCPYMFARFKELDYDIYSNSPSMQGLPDIQMLQRMRKSMIEAGEKAVDPTILAKQDAAMGGIEPVAGAIIPGGLDDQGKETIKALQVTGSAALGVDLEELITKGIEDFYLVPLYMMYYQEGKMTATEINQRAMERAMLMSINVFPVENELLSPMVARELDIMERLEVLPPDMPKDLAALMNKDVPYYAIQYEGEQHKAQEIIKANGIMVTLEGAASLSQYEPTIGLAIKGYDCLSTLGRANGMPMDHLLTQKEYKKVTDDLKTQQAAQQQAAAAAIDPRAAETAGNTADRYQQQLASMRY